jgi:hypothetical protein
MVKSGDFNPYALITRFQIVPAFTGANSGGYGNNNSIHVYLRANLTAQRPTTKLGRVHKKCTKIIKRTKYKI